MNADTVRTSLQRPRDWIDGLPQSHRALLFAGGVLVLAIFWYSLLIAPLEAEREKLSAAVQAAHSTIADLNAKTTSLAEARAVDPNFGERRRLAALRDELVETRSRVLDVTGELIPPDRMAAVLEAVLNRDTNLELTRLEGLGATPVRAETAEMPDPDPEAETDVAALTTPPLFKHGLRIELRGTYLDTLSYLQALEALPWRFLWDSVSFEVQDYPHSTVSITVYSLSMEDAWIGV